MRKTVFVIMAFSLILSFSAIPVMAETVKDNVGCGIGTMIFQDSRPSVLAHILAATTNGILGNQTFGISSGTLGCKQPPRWVSNELNTFVAANMDSLAKDIANGKGESLDTLAELMKVPAEKRADFNLKLHSNFERIFPSSTVQSADVLNNIYEVIHS